jgi:hypothetical protein
MDFLELNEICDWARNHALVTGDGFSVQLPVLPSRHYAAYAHGPRSGLEAASANDLVLALGAWDECVVWIRQWGIWGSGEDWPKFYGWRGAREERRSLENAPGHRFGPQESGSLVELLGLVMENAWDADVFCSVGGNAGRVRAHVSHDEWCEVFGASGAA